MAASVTKDALTGATCVPLFEALCQTGRKRCNLLIYMKKFLKSGASVACSNSS
jgi:hypothetical protein